MLANPDVSSESVPVKSDKSTTPAPAADWMAMFDTPGTGLLASVKSAPTRDALDQILTQIIESLFRAPGHAGTRANYLSIAREATKGHSGSLEKSRDATVILLQHLRRKHAKNNANLSVVPGSEKTSGETSPDARDTLLDIFTRSSRRPFEAIAAVKGKAGTGVLPFLLSPDFTDHFIAILKKELFPVFVQSFRGILVQADGLPPAEREEFLVSKLEGRKQQAFLLDTWHTVWRGLIEEKEIPQKPEAKAGGIFKKMLDKIDTRPASGRRELTPGQWQAKKIEIEAANRKARAIWRAICRESDHYQAPQDCDKNLLRDMFGRSAAGLEKQVTALHQIAAQGGSVKAFETYVKGRNVDMAFLAAAYRHPGLFLPSPKTGKENNTRRESFIENVLKGFNASARRQMFPLLYRFVLSAAGR